MPMGARSLVPLALRAVWPARVGCDRIDEERVPDPLVGLAREAIRCKTSASCGIGTPDLSYAASRRHKFGRTRN